MGDTSSAESEGPAPALSEGLPPEVLREFLDRGYELDSRGFLLPITRSMAFENAMVTAIPGHERGIMGVEPEVREQLARLLGRQRAEEYFRSSTW